MLIKTNFDNPLEEDIIFEETEEQLSYVETLKNSENILKSFLYLKNITDSSSPYINAIVKMDTVDYSGEKTSYLFSQDTGLILLKNIDSLNNGSIFFNNGEFVLFPYESIEFPLKETSQIELHGKFSILESEYKLGKA